MFNFLKKRNKSSLKDNSLSANISSPNIFDKVETDIKIIGNRTTNVEIIALLSYIRNIINSGKEGTIRVSVGKNINSDFFAFSVNNQEVVDLKPKAEISIN